MNFLEEIKKLQPKDLVTLVFSGMIVLFAFLQWKVRRQDFIMEQLKTACKNFFTICLNHWTTDLDKMIINGDFGQEIKFNENENEFYLAETLGFKYPPEFKKYTPWRLKRQINYLWKKVEKLKNRSIDVRRNVCDLANKCYKQINDDLSILTLANLKNIEIKYTIDFIINAILYSYKVAQEMHITSSTDKKYTDFFSSPIVSEFVEKQKNENHNIIKLNDNLFYEATGLANLLNGHRQKLSIEYHIPLNEV